MSNSFLTVNMITREAIQLFASNNTFLMSVGDEITFAGGTVLRVTDVAPEPIVPVSLPVAVAMGVVAIVIKNPVVSRRFWSRVA